MDNSNLREHQKTIVTEALMIAATARQFAEVGQPEEAKHMIDYLIEHLSKLACESQKSPDPL